MDAAQARHDSPQAYAARRASRSAYAQLSSEGAAEADEKAFPTLIGKPAGGPPELPAGERITGYPTADAAAIELGEGKHAVAEGLEPIAIETEAGKFTPINLALSEAEARFDPTLPLVSVQISKLLALGAQLPGRGLSLTPTNAQGVPLAASGETRHGVSVFYANTQAASDTVIKPTTTGLEVASLLRSPESPERLFFKVGLPPGASLVQAPVARGGVQVLKEGAVIALLPEPNAIDAAGTAVPVSMALSGDMLTLTVTQHAGEYQYPIAVDPEFRYAYDAKIGGPGNGTSNWLFNAYVRAHFKVTAAPVFDEPYYEGSGYERMESIAPYKEGEWQALHYETQGESKIYRARELGISGRGAYHYRATLQFQYHEEPKAGEYVVKVTNEAPQHEPPEGTFAEVVNLCAKPEPLPCSPAGVPQNNFITFQETSTNPQEPSTLEGILGNENLQSGQRAFLFISQEHPPEASFNTQSTYIPDRGERKNVLSPYWTEQWMGPYTSTVFEAKAHDKGVGLSHFDVSVGEWYNTVVSEYYTNKKGYCAGIQCPQSQSTALTYSPKMPDGEDEVKVTAENAMSERVWLGSASAKIKVDGTPPGKITIQGLGRGQEISDAPHTITVKATDGSGSTLSSGMQSLAIKVDGKAVGSPESAYCSPGPCTAGAKFTIDAGALATGLHTLTVKARDNANNESAEEFLFAVRAAAPLHLGPGNVDSASGQLSVSAADVNLAGVGAVSRIYRSREPDGGAGGPLGPQWAINLGQGEGLTVLPTGNVDLTASNGQGTIFARNEKGEYESPKGDSNLKLEPKESEPGKGISEFWLSDSTAGATTKFAPPTGAQSIAPTFIDQFGAEAQLNHPISDAIDSGGNVWVTDSQNNRIQKLSPLGALLKSYGSAGSGSGQFNSPWGIAIDPRIGNVYVTDQGNNRIEEFSSSGTFIKTFGWGVSDGRAQLEVCASGCRAGIAGSGNGQVNTEAGVSVDSSGNVWVADFGNNRIEEFNEKGEFLQTFGTAGKGPEQFEGPVNIAFSGANLYITDYRNNRVEEYSTSGKHEGQFGEGGTGNGQFSNPYGIASDSTTGDIYVVDSGNARVQQFSASGAFITKFASAGKEPGQLATPNGIAVNSVGSIYVVDNAANNLDEWMRPFWVPREVGGPLAKNSTTYAYETVEVEGKPVTEPTEALAPMPAGVSSCSPKLERGCRALTFNYAKATTATEGEWGDYKGHLTRVYFTAWDPAAAKMSEPTTVAQYAYDTQGRLRAEWDPRIQPQPLKTIYGYDGEGHVTALTTPGQEPWLFNYGTSEGDGSAGRLISVVRPSAETAAGNGQAPQSTSPPTVSPFPPTVGEQETATTGQWSNTPLTYSYQWFDCSYPGGNIHEAPLCEPIPGADNATYTPLVSDRNFELSVAVTATNASGSTASCVGGPASKCPVYGNVSGASELSKEPPQPPPAVGSNSVWTLEYEVPIVGGRAPNVLGPGVTATWGQTDHPIEGTAVFPPDEPMGWPAGDYKRATIHYLDSDGRAVNTATPSGAIATSEYNETNNLVRSLSADNREAALKEGIKSAEVSKLLDTQSTYSPDGTQLLETRGPQHTVKLAGGGEVRARNHVKYSYNEEAPTETHEAYDLVTKATDGAEYEGKESDVRTTVTSYRGQKNLGWKLRKPTSVTTDPGGLNLTKATVYDENTGDVLESTSPAGAAANPLPTYSFAFGSLGSGEGQFEKPWGVAINQKTGHIYVSDYAASRVEELSPSGTFLSWIGKPGSLPKEGEMLHPEAIAVDAKGNIWVGDGGNARVDEFNIEGKPVGEIGVIKGNAPGEFGGAIDGIAASTKYLWVSDTANNRIEKFSLTYRLYKGSFGTEGSEKGQFRGPAGLLVSGANLYVDDARNHRVQEFSTGTKEEAISQFGAPGKGNGQLEEPIGIAADPKSGDLYVSDYGSDRVEEFTAAGQFVAWLGSSGLGNGQFKAPLGVATSASGNLYVVDAGNTRMSAWLRAYSGTHTMQTIYYGSASNAKHPKCGKHPEWANLPCQTQPAAQPETPGLPSLPVTRATYNIWDQPETTSETFGTTTRTKKLAYDSAGRAKTSEVGTGNRSMPAVTYAYNEKTGAMTTQSAGGKTITSKYNTLGQLETYTDADGNTTTYAYEKEKDHRLLEVNYGELNGEGATQAYTYDATTGAPTKLVDTSTGTVTATQTFMAGYDVEGNMVTETYPNGMSATYARNQLGQATSLQYVKASNCGGSCTWFSDAIVPSIHGETLKQVSTLSEEPSYSYDAAGRLTQVQEIPASKGCSTRSYAYDEEGNRTSLTSSEPGSKGECATEKETVELHTYDGAGRLNDSGMSYDEFGNTTKLPASDAGGHELTSAYYVDSQLESQSQNGKTINYYYDPTGRTRETASASSPTAIMHFASSGDALTWTVEGSTDWTRNIPGINGMLCGIMKSTAAPELQLHDLKGDIVATASLSVSASKLLSSFNSTEFGVPAEGKEAPKYAWLGAFGLSSELSSGAAASGGASYVPQVGRALQTDQVVPPGALPNGSGPGAGYVPQISPWSEAASDATAATIIAEVRAARQKAAEEAARREAERAPPPGEVPSPGEGGADPCTSTFNQATWNTKGVTMEAWADIEWCYTGASVTFARDKYFPHHRQHQAFLNAYVVQFWGWQYHAYYQMGGWYYIERIAVFRVHLAKLLEIISPLPDEGFFFIDLEFNLGPHGEAFPEESSWCEPELLC